MEPGGSEPGGFNGTGGNDFGYVSDFGFDHDHHDGGDHGHGDHGHDHFGEDAGGDHDHDRDQDGGGGNQNQGSSLKGLIARLLGLDKDVTGAAGGEAGSDAGASKGGETATTPSQSAMYANAIAGISLAEAFKGIRVTPNFLYLCLFAGFTFWLFVVYWIRHNEPMANQVLGNSPVHTRHSVDDRRLLNSVKEAMPFRTSSTFGDIYTPNAPHVPPGQPLDHELMTKMNNAKPMGAGSTHPLQEKMLSAAAQQPYLMSSATAQYANQYVNQAVGVGTGQAGFPSAQAVPNTQQHNHRLASYASPASVQRHQSYQAYPTQAPVQQYGVSQYPTQSRYGNSPYGAAPNYSNSQYAGAYPNQIAAAGSYYPPQNSAPQSYGYAPAPLMEAPHGMGAVPQQFGTASQMGIPSGDAQAPRLKTVISR